MRTVVLTEIVLTELRQTGWGCPSQWEGSTSDGETFYARYRWGGWRIDIDGVTVAEGDEGGKLSGICDFSELIRWARSANVLLIEPSS